MIPVMVKEVPPPPGAAADPAGEVSIDRRRAIDRLIELLSISSPTGEEASVRDYLVMELTRIGVPRSAIRIDDAPARISLPCQTGNLIVRLAGDGPGPPRLLSAHMDTVPLAKNAEPVIRGDRIVAMGKTALGGDDRAGVAAVMAALHELLRRGLRHPPLTVLFTVREESGLRGARAVRREDLGDPTAGFNFDGGDPSEVTIGATGSMKLQIEVRGVAAHAGVHPERGVSAVAVFAEAAASLERDGWMGKIVRPEGKGTSNIGVVQGGEATNIVTPRLAVQAEARSHDPAFLRRIVEEYRAAFNRSAESHRSSAGQCGVVQFQAEESYTSFLLPEDAPVVQTALAAARRIGLTPRTRISDGGLDANWLREKSIPTVSLGCGQHEIHTTDEYLVIEEFLVSARLALELVRG
jgi:tripeptide aminopeptidase